MPDTNLDSLKVGGAAMFPNAQDEYLFWVAGVQTAAALKQQFVVCCPGTIVAVQAWLETAPTGSTFIVDCKKNGVTLFTTQANRPTIAIAGQASTTTLPDIVSLAAGDRLSIDVAQIGSGTAGSNLSVTIAVKRTNVA